MEKKKYSTEEERIAVRKEYLKRYYQKNKEKITKQRAEYYQDNKEKIAEYQAEYRKNNKEKLAEQKAEYYQKNKEKLAEQKAEYYQKNKEKITKQRVEYYQNNKEKEAEYRKNNKEKIAERMTEYRKNNKEKIHEQQAEYRKNNREKELKRHAEYRSTKYGRAKHLLRLYRRCDRQNKVIKALNRGECTLTVDWIVDNVFSGQSCVYCGESDWMKLGCDRKDSWFPHTPENCIPCCKDCNTKKNTTPYDLYMKVIGKIA